MSWLFLLAIAYLLIALATLVDKFVVSKISAPPALYTLLVTTLGLVVVFLAPFGFQFIFRFNVFLLALVAGGGYTLAIYYLYTALQRGEATRVFTAIGAVTAVVTFILSYIFLDERLTIQQLGAFILLMLGGVFIAGTARTTNAAPLGRCVISGTWFGVSYVAAKALYELVNFITGFIWLRALAFVVALLFLLLPRFRCDITTHLRSSRTLKTKSHQVIIITGQIAVALGFLLVNYTISLTSASLVLAAQGIQYAFLFLLTFFLRPWLPLQLREDMSVRKVAQKTGAVVLIAAALALLAR